MDNHFRILVVDDNRSILTVYKHALVSSVKNIKKKVKEDDNSSCTQDNITFKIAFCNQAESAVSTIEKSIQDNRPFSVVFMDLKMPPGRDGIWAAKMIRRMDVYIEIVIVTGDSEMNPADISAEIRPLHKLLYLEKPLHRWEITQFAVALSKKWQNEREILVLKNGLEKKVMQQTNRIATTNLKLSREIDIRKQTQENLKVSLQNLRQAFSGIIQVITSMIEVRDPYTAGHQSRVADLARSIAAEMKIPGKIIEGIRIAATVHDLGKISIPSDILNKPGDLTDIETLLIQNHVKTGYDLLKNINFPWPIAEIIYQHHEKLDGSGYPNGLSGDAILLEAKILTVADVVEAMQSHRPYRSSLGITQALDEIIRNQGYLYDSKVVDTCVQLFKEKEFNFKL